MQHSTVRLILIGILDLALAIVVGGLLAAPFYVAGWRAHHDRYTFTELPELDVDLAHWGSTKSGAKDFEVKREDKQIVLDYKNKSRRGVTPPWENLGYKGLQDSTISKPMFPTLDQSTGLLVTLLCGQLGFLVFGLRRMRVTAKAGFLDPAPLRGPVGPALASGAVAGVALLVFGIMYGLAVHAIFGPKADTTGIWAMVKDLPLWGRIAIVVSGAVVAPVCEEVFFRGGCYASFAGAGRPRVGLWTSAIFFSLVHFHLENTPAYVVFGLILATVYRRTNSILAPMLAHVINNAGAFALLLIPKS